MIESMLLGSVSAEVIDHAPVPVLVCAARRRPDRSRLGSIGLRHAAADLLRAWPIFARSSVRVVSVADLEVPWWTGFPAPGSPETLSLSLEAADASRRTHDALAREMTDEMRAAGLEAVAERRNGDAATEIIDAAGEAMADVIVLGTHGRTGLARLVLGSVARNVLHHAACSVLITRAPAGSN